MFFRTYCWRWMKLQPQFSSPNIVVFVPRREKDSSKMFFRTYCWRWMKLQPQFSSPNKHNICPIMLSTNCNMSCDWKLSGRGRAAKQAKYPCVECSIQSGFLHTKTQDKEVCHICIELGHVHNPECICHHIFMCTEDHIQKLCNEVEGFTANYARNCHMNT